MEQTKPFFHKLNNRTSFKERAPTMTYTVDQNGIVTIIKKTKGNTK